MRRLVTLSSLAALLMITTSARGGGAVWEFQGYHRPGDIVESTTAVAWDHNTALGTPEDGPYLLFLAPEDVDGDTWPQVPEESLLVGIVEVREGPFTVDGGDRYGPHHAIARFEIPDVDTGSYQIFHCNDPCTKTLGDVVGGWGLRVIGGPGGRPAGDIDTEVRSRVATSPRLIPAETTATESVVGEHPAATSMPEPSVPVEETASAPVDEGGPRASEVRQVGGVELGSAATRDRAAMAEQPLRFDSLWLIAAGVISLLLVVQIVRIDSRCRRQPAAGGKPRNETPLTDVLTDE